MRKILITVISVLFLFSTLGILANAYNNESLIIDDCIEVSFIVDVTGEGQVDSVSTALPQYYYQHDSSYSLSHNCYDSLSAAQKLIYDAVVSNPGAIELTITFPNGVFPYSEWGDAFFTELMYAIATDRPDICYFAGNGVSSGYLYSGGEYVYKIDYYVTSYNGAPYTSSNAINYYNSLMSELASVPVDLSNRYNFVLSIHDYLCNNVYYPDLNTSDYVKTAHDAYGALVEGRAVCQGYSDAFKLICDYYNIPAVCISGTANGGGHMWNAVQMDDGLWYLLDITWDDQGELLFDDFFLVGTQSENTYFGGNSFSTDHVNDVDLPYPLTNLNYASTAYNRTQNHYTGFGATLNCEADTENKHLFLSVFDIGKSNIYYDGIYVNVNSFESEETFVVPSGNNKTDETWTMYVLADLNGDGVCDANDYSIAINLASDDDDVVNSTAEYCCDVNCDGYINVLDTSLIARASTGLNTDI